MTSDIRPKVQNTGLVIDIQAFRRKKAEEDALVRGRKPLYVSHKLVDRQARGQDQKLSDFSERITKIRLSLDKINTLMIDLRRLSAQDLRGTN